MKFLLLLLSVSLLSFSASAQLGPSMEAPFLQLIRAQLKLNNPDLPEVVGKELSPFGNRDHLSVTLKDGEGTAFRVLVDGPRGFSTSSVPRPCLFTSAGFFAGTQAVELLGDSGEFLIVAFEYAKDPQTLLRQPESLLRTMKSVPGRLFFSIKWLQEQPWILHSQFHVMGVSLGSLYLPVTLRLLQTSGIPFTSFISAFGGAQVRGPFTQILRSFMGDHEADLTAQAVSALITPFSPQIYLPNLEGPKLVIHGAYDEVFTPDISADLDGKLSGPKVTCVVQGHHIDLARAKEIQLTVGLLKPWLESSVRGAKELPLLRQNESVCVRSL